jgi:hypothetical protein
LRSFKSGRYFVYVESSFLPQHHDGDADDRLRHRIDAKDRVLPHRRGGARIFRSEGLEIGDLSVPHHQDHRAWYATRFNVCTKHLAETGEPVGGHADLLGLRTAQRIGSAGHQRNKKSSRNDRGADNVEYSHGRPPI